MHIYILIVDEDSRQDVIYMVLNSIILMLAMSMPLEKPYAYIGWLAINN